MNEPKPKKPKKPKPTEEQLKAREQDRLARADTKAKSLQNGQKIIIGGMVLSMARKDAGLSKFLLASIKEQVTRANDIKRLDDIIIELKSNVERLKK